MLTKQEERENNNPSFGLVGQTSGTQGIATKAPGAYLPLCAVWQGAYTHHALALSLYVTYVVTAAC